MKINDKPISKLLISTLLFSATGVSLAADNGERIDHYIVYQNGTVLDSKTGLLWKRCSQNQRWNGKTCTGALIKTYYDDAYKSSQFFAGYGDWMLPAIRELASLVYCPSGKPTFYPWLPDSVEAFKASQLRLSDVKLVKNWREYFANACQGDEQATINTRVFPLPSVQSSPLIYWSATRADEKALSINFSTGAVADDKRSGEHYVRLKLYQLK